MKKKIMIFEENELSLQLAAGRVHCRFAALLQRILLSELTPQPVVSLKVVRQDVGNELAISFQVFSI